MGEFIHPATATKLRFFLILGTVPSLFHVRREVVLGPGSEALNRSVSNGPQHPILSPSPWLTPSCRHRPELTQEALTGLNLEKHHAVRHCSGVPAA